MTSTTQKYVPKILGKPQPSDSNEIGFVFKSRAFFETTIPPSKTTDKSKNSTNSVILDINGNIASNLPLPSSPSKETKPLRSVLVTCKPNTGKTTAERKLKKKVTFAPGTINYCRELKPYKYHNMFKTKRLPKVEPEFPRPQFLNIRPPSQRSTSLASHSLDLLSHPKTKNKLSEQLARKLALVCPPTSISGDCSNIPDSVQAHEKDVKDDQARPSQKSISGGPGSDSDDDDEEPLQFENDYVAFTHARKTYDYMSKRSGPAATRAQRLFQIGQDLRSAHATYNSLRTTESRDRFLLDQILLRYIMALDLALTENYIGFALELTHAMTDTTSYMLPLYSQLFYNTDGSRTQLPMVMIPSGQQPVENCATSVMDELEADYVQMIAPVVSSLNRISRDRPRYDNRFLSCETLLTKLQLEMITLVICPIKSIMFRAILEIVPTTAKAAHAELLKRGKSGQKSETDNDGGEPITSTAAAKSPENLDDGIIIQDENAIRWVNNSSLYKDYVTILRSIGLADKIGCLSHVPTISMDHAATPVNNNSNNISVSSKTSPSPGHSNMTTGENLNDRINNSTFRPFSPMNMHNTNLG